MGSVYLSGIKAVTFPEKQFILMAVKAALNIGLKDLFLKFYLNDKIAKAPVSVLLECFLVFWK